MDGVSNILFSIMGILNDESCVRTMDGGFKQKEQCLWYVRSRSGVWPRRKGIPFSFAREALSNGDDSPDRKDFLRSNAI